MNRREQIVEEVANIERELSERVSQDTLVVFHRKLRGLVEYANHHGLPDRKPVELIHHVETRMDEDSLARINETPSPIAVKDVPAESKRLENLGFERTGEDDLDEDGNCNECGYELARCRCANRPDPLGGSIDPPCEHPNKSFNDEGLPVCNDCGHIFKPPPTKPTIDRKAAIDDLFGKG